MSYISLSKPLFAAYNNISTGPGNSSSESAHPSNNQAMEVTTTTSTTNEAEDIPQEMFSIEWIYTNRELAMELLLGNFAGDESFADLLRLPANMLNDSDDSSDIYEDDEDVDMEGTSEEVTEESTERIWNGDILRGVDEDYDWR